MKKWTA